MIIVYRVRIAYNTIIVYNSIINFEISFDYNIIIYNISIVYNIIIVYNNSVSYKVLSMSFLAVCLLILGDMLRYASLLYLAFFSDIAVCLPLLYPHVSF